MAISYNQTVNENDVVNLNCTADGNPAPNITWTKVFDNSTVSFPLIISSKDNEGFFRCIADNGVGQPASRDMALLVKSKFVMLFQLVILRKTPFPNT